MGGFLQGMVQGIEQGRTNQRQREMLALQKQQIDAQMKGMELDQKLKAMQVEDFVTRRDAQTRLPSLMSSFSPSGAPLSPGAMGPETPTEPQPLSQDRVFSLVSTAQQAGQDPNALMGLMSKFDPRLRALFADPKTVTLKPGETLGEYTPGQGYHTIASAPDKQNPIVVSPGQTVFQPGAQEPMFSVPAKPERPVAVSPGSTLIDPSTNQPIYTAPEKPQHPIAVSPGSTLIDPTTQQPIFTAPDREKPVAVAPGANLVNPATGQVLFSAPPKESSPVNPVDQYIFAKSGGLYKNMAEAAAAGETKLIQEAERVVREQRPLDRAIAVGGAKQELAKKDPLSVEDANKLGVPFGTTKEEATGLMPLTAQQREAKSGFSKARSIIADIKKYSQKVNTFEAGFGSRIIEGGKNVYGAFTQENEDAALLRSKAGELAQLARSMGEKGAMAEGDIQRAANLVPSLTDTKKVAEAKIADLETLISEAEKAFDESLKPVSGISTAPAKTPSEGAKANTQAAESVMKQFSPEQLGKMRVARDAYRAGKIDENALRQQWKAAGASDATINDWLKTNRRATPNGKRK